MKFKSLHKGFLLLTGLLLAAGGLWGQDKTPEKEEKVSKSSIIIKFPDKPAYPEALTHALEKFNKMITPDITAVEKAKEARKEKLNNSRKESDAELLELLESEIEKAQKKQRLKCKGTRRFFGHFQTRRNQMERGSFSAH